MKTRVFSGIQPTGNLHLGNYLGAIRPWVTLQDQHECVFSIVDMHAITLWQDPSALRRARQEMAAALLAAGLDPARCILFVQSAVDAHAKLAWILNCVARVGWLNRMTQFKEKTGKHREGASVGLYVYPILQAADILAYRATHVPVGEDQKQHLELARDIAQKFNLDYSVDLFPEPEPMITQTTARIMSLRDGTAKMSKSDPSDMSRINLCDTPDDIRNKIKRAKTDPELLPDDPELLQDRPEARNLVGIYAALSGESQVSVLNRFSGQGFGTFKPALADLAIAQLEPISRRFHDLMNDPDHLDALLEQGAQGAAAIANPVVQKAYEIVGFRK